LKLHPSAEIPVLAVRRKSLARKGNSPPSLQQFHIKILAASRQAHQSIPNRIHHKFCRLVNPQPLHNVCAMHRHRIRAQLQFARNLFIRFSRHNMLQNLQLPRGQPKIPFALHGPLRRKVRSWLRRAELAVNDTTSIETLKPGPPLQFTCDSLLTWPMQPALVA